MAITKLELYNGALILLGQRSLSSDTEARNPRYDLDDIYSGAVDYCLEMVKPRFATLLVTIAGATPTAVTGYSNQATLPANFKAIAGVYADGKMEQPIVKYVHEANYILSDFDDIYLRYVQDFSTVGLTYMPQSFGRVVSAYMARELSVKIDPDTYEEINAELETRIGIASDIDGTNEVAKQGLAVSTLTDVWRRIFNDALLILGQDPIANNNDDSVRKNRLSLALDAELVESALEDSAWGFGSQSDQISYDPSVDPAWGYSYALEKPADLHRLDGVYGDEYFQTPIRDYIDEDGYIFCGYQTIYIQYTSKTFITTPDLWPSYFKRLVAARMAVDAGPAIPGSDVVNAKEQYKDRRSEAMSTDAIQSPPKTLTQGSWSSSRGYRGSGRRDRP